MSSATKMTPPTAMRSRRNRRIHREFHMADRVSTKLLPVPLSVLRPVLLTVPPEPPGVGLDMPLDVERWVSAATCDLLPSVVPRSEEHTSELQSRENLVCRLLLEKKKNSC